MDRWNEHNFFMATEATWFPMSEPYLVPDYISDSGSEYWYSNNGVVRGSDHWGAGVGSCDWFMEGDDWYSSWDDNKGKRYGYCPWGKFGMKYPDLIVSIYDESVVKEVKELYPSGMYETWDDSYVGHECANVLVKPEMLRDGKVYVTDDVWRWFDPYNMMGIYDTSRSAALLKRSDAFDAGGDCFIVALQNQMDDPTLTLCHGIVHGQGQLEGYVFPHAWNETEYGTVIDQSNGNNVELPKDVYYALGGIETVYKYDHNEMLEIVVNDGTYGPWEDELKAP